jgi:acyl-homoserine-lactone acylase
LSQLRWRRRPALVLLAFGALLAAATTAAAAQYSAQISRTAGGIPHVRASGWGDLGFGAGYAYAQDNLCTLADEVVTLSAQRSRYFGPDAVSVASAKGSNRNLDSDFFWQSIKDRRVVERLVAQRPPRGPRAQVRAMVRGYAAGYNAYLRETRIGRLPDPRCRGKAWVRPIREIDLWRRYYQLALLASSGVFIGELAATEPPGAATTARATSAADAATWWRSIRPSEQSLGSNAIGLGSRATESGRGMLLANPHFPWIGGERFYQFHLTLPGKLNVQGASLHGVPVVNIGFNERVAWSHTVSTGWRFTPFRLALVPGNPRAYVVDGKEEKMTSRTVRVRARTRSGKLETRRHTFWYSRYGPVMTLPDAGYGWGTDYAYALGDVNADNMRVVNVWLDMNRARTVDDLVEAQSRSQGVPWVNTIAADRRGVALYQDNSVVPAVSRAKIASCVPEGLPALVYEAAGVVTLDGSRSECGWARERGALVPGIMAPRHLPILKRRDYVQNSNDSYWLSNAERPLTGFSPIIGTEETELNLRTRYGLRLIAARLAGRDGLAGSKFTVGRLRRLWQRNASEGGRVVGEQLADLCEANPSVDVGEGTIVDVRAACPVIRAWDATARLDSKGAWLFGAWWANAGSLFSDPFEPSNPLTTPNRLAASPDNVKALGLAVQNLRSHGLPLDASPRQAQYARRHGRKIPIPGCFSGCYQYIYGSLDTADDSESQGVPVSYGQVLEGSSTVMQVELGRRGPKGTTILTYSQSENPRSPHSGDQTSLFSAGEWLPIRFTRRAIARDPQLRRYTVRGG